MTGSANSHGLSAMPIAVVVTINAMMATDLNASDLRRRGLPLSDAYAAHAAQHKGTVEGSIYRYVDRPPIEIEQ